MHNNTLHDCIRRGILSAKDVEDDDKVGKIISEAASFPATGEDQRRDVMPDAWW